MTTFQDLLTTLTTFWAEKGCVIHQGHDIETGAATFNPATFLRALGPESYNAVYVEPSRRPQDGRYGENPNRLQLFHQMQVVLKPSPAEIQKMYLESLEAIGFDLSKHDVRFVHDDWEGPTLGAWGLGWEVWMDGMEITQFTYFQAVGGQTLKPIMVEIAYGLERLSMLLQNVDNVYHMKWNDTLTYGDVVKQNEIEWSHYNFTYASTRMWLQHFKDFEHEAKELLSHKLPIPAYDFVMKASHAFNILEARKVLSVTERTGYITTIRELARQTAESYIETRQKLHFPLAKEIQEPVHLAKKPSHHEHFNPKHSHHLLLEIGSEELPATFIQPAMQSLERLLSQLFKNAGVSFSSIKTYGTPRRLIAIVYDLHEGTENTKIEKKGPAISVAFDNAGRLTAQGMGFLKPLGLDAVTLKEIQDGKNTSCSIQQIKGADYLFVSYEEKGISTYELLIKELPQLILQIHFQKKMRWGSGEISYARPLRWLVSLYGDKLVPFSVGDISSDLTSYGHSQLQNAPFKVSGSDTFISQLKEHHVIADPEERKASILEQLRSIEHTLNAEALETSKVLSEVVYLSEWPMLTYSYFDSKFLSAPEDVLVSEMVSHQRYFPLRSQGKLLNAFVITADNTPQPTIIHGNEKVLSARLSDGVFLYREDLKIPLDQFNERLKTITFQKNLGSIYQKVERIEKHAVTLHNTLGLGELSHLKKAAHLCKADLASLLVNEFPELQGIIGKYYATYHQESPQVAKAIEEHWLPRFEADRLPSSQEGVILSLADKFDNILGYFSIGLKPSSSSDPYALRRQTLGVLKILLDNKISVNIEERLAHLAEHFSHPISKEVIQEIITFMIPRLKTIFEEIGFKKDEIEASMQAASFNPYDQYLRLHALCGFRKTEEFSKLYQVYKRAKGQLQENISHSFKEDFLEEDAEKALYHHLASTKKSILFAFDRKDYETSIKLLASFQNPLAKLFDEVKILSEDAQMKSNRLTLLKEVFELFSQLLDFSKIQER